MNELPFNFPVNVRKLPKKGTHTNYQADQPTREKIAAEYDLLEMSDFHGSCLISPWKRDGVKLSGVVAASYSQPCATTGEPLDVELEEKFEALFVPEGSKLSKPQLDEEGEMIVDPFGEDMPDIFQGDSIDLAQVWLEFFDLAHDPFARADDAKMDKMGLDTDEESPFSALEALKTSMKKQ